MCGVRDGKKSLNADTGLARKLTYGVNTRKNIYPFYYFEPICFTKGTNIYLLCKRNLHFLLKKIFLCLKRLN